MSITCHGLPTDWVNAIRNGGVDSNGQPAERSISDGGGNPCRHCLREIPAGAEMFVLGARPFPALQPYAETGPIFFCCEDCSAFSGKGLPPVALDRDAVLMKAYRADHRIYYGTGKILPPEEIEARAEHLFKDDAVAYIDIRSATNNCYTFRITRDGEYPPELSR